MKYQALSIYLHQLLDFTKKCEERKKNDLADDRTNKKQYAPLLSKVGSIIKKEGKKDGIEETSSTC